MSIKTPAVPYPPVRLKIDPEKWTETPKPCYEKTILLFITGKCNLRCSYCFNKTNLSQGDEGVGMDFVRKIVEANPDVKKYDIQWGEPLLHPQVNDIVRYLHSQGKKVGVYTNGYLLKNLDKDHAPLKIGISFQSIVSLDKSLKPIHDIREMLSEYQNYYDFKLVFLLNRTNVSILPEFVGYVEKNFAKIRKVTVGLVRDESDYWSDESEYALPFDRYVSEDQKFIDGYSWTLDVDLFTKGVLRSPGLPESEPSQLNRFKNVFPDGTYVPCLYLIANDEKSPIPESGTIPFPDCERCSRTGRKNCLADKIYLKNRNRA